MSLLWSSWDIRSCFPTVSSSLYLEKRFRKCSLCRMKVKTSFEIWHWFFFCHLFSNFLPVWSHFMNGAVVIGNILKKGNVQFDKSLCLFLYSLVVLAGKIIRHCYRKYLFPVFGENFEILSSGIWLSSANWTEHQLCFDGG